MPITFRLILKGLQINVAGEFGFDPNLQVWVDFPKLQTSLVIDSIGGDEEDRTPDLRIANATLSQLSYVPTGLQF